MAELTTATRSEVAHAAGAKAHQSTFNRNRIQFIDTPAVWTAANGDTAGTSLLIPSGSRLWPWVSLSCSAGGAGSTVSVGLRNMETKAPLDATAWLAATSIASAQIINVATGTKVTGGQYYIVPVDAEVYLTFGGAAPAANQAVSIGLQFVSP